MRNDDIKKNWIEKHGETGTRKQTNFKDEIIATHESHTYTYTHTHATQYSYIYNLLKRNNSIENCFAIVLARDSLFLFIFLSISFTLSLSLSISLFFEMLLFSDFLPYITVIRAVLQLLFSVRNRDHHQSQLIWTSVISHPIVLFFRLFWFFFLSFFLFCSVLLMVFPYSLSHSLFVRWLSQFAEFSNWLRAWECFDKCKLFTVSVFFFGEEGSQLNQLHLVYPCYPFVCIAIGNSTSITTAVCAWMRTYTHIFTVTYHHWCLQHMHIGCRCCRCFCCCSSSLEEFLFYSSSKWWIPHSSFFGQLLSNRICLLLSNMFRLYLTHRHREGVCDTKCKQASLLDHKIVFDIFHWLVLLTTPMQTP